MTNDKMTNDKRSANDELRKTTTPLGFRISSSIRHSSFVIRHSILILLLSLVTVFSQPKSEPRSPPLPPAQGEREARALLADLLAQKPEENSIKTGQLKIRDAKGEEKQIPVRIEVLATPTNWMSIYETRPSTSAPAATKLTVIHSIHQPNQYQLVEPAKSGPTNPSPKQLSANELMAPFAGSDFWIADLGLEFLHWPKQRVLYTDMRHHKSCNVLESSNAQPASGSYSRVLSWITIDPPHAIVHAEAYDAANKLLKQFDPKNLEKVNGQYELESMEIRTRKTGSRTILEFDLK